MAKVDRKCIHEVLRMLEPNDIRGPNDFYGFNILKDTLETLSREEHPLWYISFKIDEALKDIYIPINEKWEVKEKIILINNLLEISIHL